MSPSQDNLLDRLLKYSPWLAGALVAFCFLALVLRLSFNAPAGDREAMAASSGDEASTLRELNSREARQATASEGRRTVRVTRLEGGGTEGARALEGHRTQEHLTTIQTPSAKSRLTVHRGSDESNTADPAADPVADPNATHSPVVRSTASRLISGAAVTGQAHTSFFGVEAFGRRFAYVLDRSGSMGDPDNKPLSAAKQELLQSLARLGDTHQFFLIFYNQEPTLFNPGGRGGRQLVFADDLNKEQARRFVQSVQALGGTRHYEALSRAIALRPDVIFLLTDGEPKDDLSAEELDRLTRSNGGIAQIHVVQFANTPYDGNSLVRLARENRGQHRYKSLREIVSQREF